MSIIEVDHVTKEYRLGASKALRDTLENLGRRMIGRPVSRRKYFKALDDVNFSIEQGEVVGFIGQNGAGKSTLLKLLSRITVPTKGRISVRGRVAPLIEVGAGLIGDMTGRENIYLNGGVLGMRQAEIRRKFDEIVAFAELEQFIDTPLKRYSSGMQVRLGFAVAINAIAEILIVDEVLAVGDVAFQRKCIDRMEEIIVGGKRTVLVVGHNIRQLERICTRMVLLDRGRIVIDGDPGSVCNRFFENAEQKITAQHLPSSGEFKPSHDVGVVKVLGIELIGSSPGPAGPEIPMHGAVRIRVTVQTAKPLKRPEFGIGAHTPDMVYIFSMSSALSAIRPDLPEGISQIECAIPDVPLRPGQYSLRLGVSDHMRNSLWYGENLNPFRIVPGGTDIARIPEVGLTHLKCEWEIGQSSDTIEAVSSELEVAEQR